MLTVLIVRRNRRLVLVVKLGWWQGKTLGSEGKLIGSGLLGVWSSGEKLSVWAAYCAWRAAL
jgi:hypothetical protein